MRELLVLLFLILLNGYFSLAEMAVVSASRPLLRQMAKQGNTRAALALRLSEDSGKFLSTTEIFSTLIGILTGAYGGAALSAPLQAVLARVPLLAPYAATLAVSLILAAITFITIVIGELVPKQIALGRAETIAMLVSRPMQILAVAATPLVKLLGFSVDTLMHLLGLFRRGEAEVTEAEVKAVLAEGAESGAIEKNEHDMLQRIMRLGEREIRAVMTHRSEMTALDVNDDYAAVCNKISHASHARYPVIDGDPDHVVGYVEANHFVATDWGTNPGGFSLRYHMKPASSIHEHASCLKALEMFRRRDVHLLTVVDEYGTTEGIVTATDLLEAVVGLMPSTDSIPGSEKIRQRDDGSWLVDALVPIDELHLTLGLAEIEKGGYETLAGFLIQTLGHLPVEGDVIEHGGVRFEVVDMDGPKIDKVLIHQRVAETADVA